VLPDGSHRDVNRVTSKPVLPPGIAETETSMLETVLQYGTAKAAAIGQFAAGKTGTTENYGDAWFIGWDSKYTVAVWVGYPNKLIPMTSDFNGGPVLGGTFPALIWHDFMTSATQIDKTRAEEAALRGERSEKGSEKGGGSSTSSEALGAPLNPESPSGQTQAPANEGQAQGKPPKGSGNGKTPSPGEHNEAPQGGGQAQPPGGSGSQPGAPPASPSPSTPPPTAPAPAAPSQPSSPPPEQAAPPSGSGGSPGTGGASPGG
jgi:penicillin-binding protein 1A